MKTTTVTIEEEDDVDRHRPGMGLPLPFPVLMEEDDNIMIEDIERMVAGVPTPADQSRSHH